MRKESFGLSALLCRELPSGAPRGNNTSSGAAWMRLIGNQTFRTRVRLVLLRWPTDLAYLKHKSGNIRSSPVDMWHMHATVGTPDRSTSPLFHADHVGSHFFTRPLPDIPTHSIYLERNSPLDGGATDKLLKQTSTAGFTSYVKPPLEPSDNPKRTLKT